MSRRATPTPRTPASRPFRDRQPSRPTTADALAARTEPTGSRYLVTCDGYYRRGDAINQERRADNARLALGHDPGTTVEVDRLGGARLGAGQRRYDALIDEYARAQRSTPRAGRRAVP